MISNSLAYSNEDIVTQTNSKTSNTAIPFFGDSNILASQYGCISALSCCA